MSERVNPQPLSEEVRISSQLPLTVDAPRSVDPPPLSPAYFNSMEQTDVAQLSRRSLLHHLIGRKEQQSATVTAPAPADELPAAPPSPDTAERLSAWGTVKVNRRPVLGGLALFALGANAAFRKFLDGSYPYIPPELIFADGEAPTKPEQIAFFFPGFGDMHTVKEMAEIRNKGEFPSMIPIAGFTESQDDATPTEKARLAKEKIDMSNLKSVILLARSMGGQDAWEFAAEFAVPVDKMFMFSSPFRLANGFDGSFGKLFAHAPDDRELAFIGKLIYGWQESKAKNGLWDVTGDIEGAWHQALAGDDPITLERRAKASIKNNLWKLARSGRLKGIFTENTDVYYTDAKHPRNDPTVHVVESRDEYRQLCEYLGCRYHHMGIPEGHADISVSSTALNPLFQALLPDSHQKILAEGTHS